MSPYQQNIVDFYKIYEEHPDFFSDKECTSLEGLKANFSEDDSIRRRLSCGFLSLIKIQTLNFLGINLKLDLYLIAFTR